MGMVFQNYAVWPHKTVYENVVFGLKLRKIAGGAGATQGRGDAGAGQPHRAWSSAIPNELSGGQQQRVALARSLVVEPEILLLDEPLSNLDAKLRERMRVELKQLQRRTGITFVYVTHDQAEALALSDQIAVIHGGRLQQYGTPQEVYARPANRVVADFMGLVNLVPAKVIAARNGWARVEAAGGLTLEVALPDGIGTGDSVEVAIRPENIRLQPPAARRHARHRSATAPSSATSASITPASTPVRRFGCRPIRRRSSRSATRSRSRSTPTQCSVFRSEFIGVRHERRQRQHVGRSRARSTGPRRATPSCSCGRSARRADRRTAPSCSCTARRWPRSRPSTCRCRAGRTRSAMDYFAERGFDTWCVDMEGYGRSTKDRGIDATIAEGADDLEGRHRLHLQDPQPHRAAAGLRHLVGRAARGAVRAAPSQSRASGSRSTPTSGPAKAARRWRSGARSCRSFSRPSAGRSTRRSCARSSSATIPAPPTTT